MRRARAAAGGIRTNRGQAPPLKRTAVTALAVAALLSLGAFVVPVGAKSRNAAHRSANGRAMHRSTANRNGIMSGYHEPLCASRSSLCTDVFNNPGDEYVGHDEPSVEFKSSQPGSGNNMTYTVTLPKNPSTFPNGSGLGGATWD